MLHLGNAKGSPVIVLPLALCTVLEQEAGLFDVQIYQVHRCELEWRSGTRTGESAHILARAKRALEDDLRCCGANGVRSRSKHGVPLSRGRSGKVQRVVGMS